MGLAFVMTHEGTERAEADTEEPEAKKRNPVRLNFILEKSDVTVAPEQSRLDGLQGKNKILLRIQK